MKAWWLNLSLREKQVISAGAILIVFMMIYLLVLSPSNHYIKTLREQIHDDQNLLVWMQMTDKQIQPLEKNQHAMTDHSSSALLNIIQQNINHSEIAKNLTELKQAENDAIQLHFQDVSFDLFSAWLIQVGEKQNLSIMQMTTVPRTDPGMVDVDLKLQSTAP